MPVEKLSRPLHTNHPITMDTLTSFAKENFQLTTLVVGLLGVLIGIWTVYYEVKKKRKPKDKQKKEQSND